MLNEPLRTEIAHLDRVFSALSDPTRRAILSQLTTGAATVGELAAPQQMSMAAVSRHVKVLASVGLLERHREGKKIHCRLRAAPMREAVDWLNHYRRFWDQKLDALETFMLEDAGRDD